MKSIADYQTLYNDSSTTVESIIRQCLADIEAASDYNAVISLQAENAIERAREIDQQRTEGQTLGTLAGVPFLAKDNFLTYSGATTAASKMLGDFAAPYQSTAVTALEKAGAICVGKANLDAFAHGSSTENSDFGVTKNPHDTSRVPGGSSGGSAAAVALGLVPFALGSDTGGSIRLPASYCGVVGHKPTYGAVSRYGVVAMASSTDTIGVLATSAADASTVMDIIAGPDSHDGTTLPNKVSMAVDQSLPPLKIGVIEEFMDKGVSDYTRRSVEAGLSRLEATGHTIERISIPSIRLALGVYYIIVPAEISSNLARYDGIKYGHRAEEATTLAETYHLSRAQGFNAENKRRIMIGNYVLSSGYYDAYYRKAQLVRTKLINELRQALSQCDVLAGPVAPSPAFEIGSHADPLEMYLVDIMTVAASVTGLPALSVPAPLEATDGLPVGLQLIGQMGDDARLLSLAHQLEGAQS